MYLAKVHVTLRKSILDPQGKAVHHALDSLHISGVRDVRIGKFVELNIDAPTQADAERAAAEACSKLLANPVMEDFAFTVEKIP
jgi:phosphoribosylformylglycinamidine synthase